MKIISVVSAKGGVGKSTVVANLAVGLRRKGYQVLALDLDPQNGLFYHFSSELENQLSHTQAGVQSTSLSDASQITATGIVLIPFGRCDEKQRKIFEMTLSSHPAWLLEALSKMIIGSDTIVIIDVSSGPSIYMTQALMAANITIAVTQPDAGSYVVQPQLQTLINNYCIGRENFLNYGFIINKIDQNRRLNKDVTSLLRSSMVSKTIGLVHADEAVNEALAHGQSIFQHCSQSEAARDFSGCVTWVEQQLASNAIQWN